MKSKPEPLTTVLPVRGQIVISGERCCCWMTEGQSVHQGVSSKFHSGISGQPVPLDDIFFSRNMVHVMHISRHFKLLYQQMVCLTALQLVHIDM